MDQNQVKDDQFLSVSQITAYIGKKFSQDPYLDHVRIKGEITNFRERPNGHQYFSLKDDGAKIGVTLFRNVYQKINFKLKDGDVIACTGKINIYAPGGSYSLVVEKVEQSGIGTLLIQLQERKERLSKAGYFAGERKREICQFPRKVAVITSQSGAVIRDIITTTRRRFPLVQLVLFPALVQGDQAAASILNQLQRANEIGDFDTIIIARGGGSFEDLWPFNDEALTIAVAESKTPVITSVGHETDTTLVDYAADLRAPTPTAAAELATPRIDELRIKVKHLRHQMRQAQLRYLEALNRQIQPYTQSYLFRRPELIYQNQDVELDQLKTRLIQSEEQRLKNNIEQLVRLQMVLKSVAPSSFIEKFQSMNHQMISSLIRNSKSLIDDNEAKLKNLTSNLMMLDPRNVLKRGYAIAESEDKKVIDSVDKVEVKQKMRLILSDGVVHTTVDQIEGETDAE